MGEHYPGSKVTRLRSDRIQDQARPVLEVIENLRWDYLSRYNRTAVFLIVGGNYLRRMFTELYERGIIEKNGIHVASVFGLTLVRVKFDCLEVGE